MHSEGNDYGLWGLVLVNSLVFIGFAYSFFKPTTTRDWRSFGAYSAFVVALFAEMSTTLRINLGPRQYRAVRPRYAGPKR